ncbi:3'-5' exoribonuclease, partial [Escherichia coli]|nr:3'-5' exoribonuclease [Escherichia coli]
MTGSNVLPIIQTSNSGDIGEASDPLIKANGHHNLTSTSRAGIHLMIDLETMGKNP